MPKKQFLYAEDLKTWLKQAKAMAYKHSRIEFNNTLYIDPEKQKEIINDFIFVAVNYHRMVQHCKEEVGVRHEDAEVHSEILESLDVMYDAYLEGKKNTTELLRKNGLEFKEEEVEENGQKTGGSDGESEERRKDDK